MTLTEMLISRANDIKALPEKELEVLRLSNMLGTPFIIKIKALTLSEYDSLPKGEDMRVHTLLKGIVSPDLKDEALRRAYTPSGRKNTITAKDLISELFLVGETANIASEILVLSGFSDGAVKTCETVEDLEDEAAAEVIKN